MRKRPQRHHHSVYVVELSKRVLEEPKFRRANPDYLPGMPCFYVGMTGLSPDERFDKHKAGIQANRFVREYGLRLRPDLFEVYNPNGTTLRRIRRAVLAVCAGVGAGRSEAP